MLFSNSSVINKRTNLQICNLNELRLLHADFKSSTSPQVRLKKLSDLLINRIIFEHDGGFIYFSCSQDVQEYFEGVDCEDFYLDVKC